MIDFNEFHFFKLSENFVKKQKLQCLFLSANISQNINICQYLHYKNELNVVVCVV